MFAIPIFAIPMRAVVAAFLFVTFSNLSARAENRALLIGASNYPSNISSLQGPANDIRAMWEILTERGFAASNIRVLADELPKIADQGLRALCRSGQRDPDCPTYANIVEALERLADGTKRGDYIILYFSGHGVQVPDLVKRNEPDGLTEGFVPTDIGRWDPSRLMITNLITDDIVGDAIEKMRDRGAFVWAIFDTCHAGDMTRGAASYAVPRLVRGDLLGIPEQAYEDAKKDKSGAQRKGGSLDLVRNKRAEGLVGFYAAQSDQLALELAFQEQDASGRQSQLIMGAMTNALRRALSQEPNATYRQLAQRIAGLYGSLGADMPAPYFEGDLDKPVFGTSAGEPIWSAQSRSGHIVVSAGELHGVEEGAILALFDGNAGTPASNPAGYAKVERASATQSEAVVIAYAGQPVMQIAGNAVLRAKLERPGLRAVLRVALPPATDAADVSPDRSGRAAIELLRRADRDRQPFAVEWLPSGRPADIHLRLRNGRVWFLSPFGNWSTTGTRQSPSIAVADVEKTEQIIRDNLWRAARAANLERLAGSYRQSTRGVETAVAKSLTVELYLYRDTRATPGRLDCMPEPPNVGGTPRGAIRIATDSPPELKHCDIIYVVMRNTGTLPIDVTLLYVEAEAQIQCFAGWGRSRIDPGEIRDRIQPFRIVTRDPQSRAPLPIGREALVIVGVEKPTRDAIETTFCHLQQQSLDSARSGGRARGGSDAFSELLDQAGLAMESARGFTAVGPKELSNVSMRTFSWNVRELDQRR